MMYMPLIISAWTASMISTTVKPALRIELHAPFLLVGAARLGILHRLVIREEHRNETGVGGALHVVLSAQRMQAGAGAADLAGDQRQRDQAARIIGAVGVLRHAHAPEDDGVLGARKGARNFAQGIRLDAADRRHLLRRERLDVLGEGVEAFGIGLHILLVVELLFDDDIEHAVEHGDVGAVLELHHLPGMAFQRLPARIHDHELGAALGGLLEEGGGDRMVLGRIGADDDDHVGILHFVEGRRHRRGADAFEQGRDRRGMAKPRAVIDIVGAEADAHELLEQIRLFVRAFRRAEAGEALRALLLADFQETFGRLRRAPRPRWRDGNASTD